MAITEATRNQFPFLVDIAAGSGMAQGILISPEWVLTTANLLIGSASADLVFGAQVNIRFGILEGDPPPQRRRAIAGTVLLHEGWNQTTFANNLALIRVVDPPELNAGVQPLATLSETGHEVGQAVLGVGRARPLTSGSGTPAAQVVDGTVVAASVAKGHFGDAWTVASQVVVDIHGAAMLTPALISSGAGGPGLVGLFNYGATTDAGPVVYSRLVDYADWIQANSGVLLG